MILLRHTQYFNKITHRREKYVTNFKEKFASHVGVCKPNTPIPRNSQLCEYNAIFWNVIFIRNITTPLQKTGCM